MLPSNPTTMTNRAIPSPIHCSVLMTCSLVPFAKSPRLRQNPGARRPGRRVFALEPDAQRPVCWHATFDGAPLFPAFARAVCFVWDRKPGLPAAENRDVENAPESGE